MGFLGEGCKETVPKTDLYSVSVHINSVEVGPCVLHIKALQGLQNRPLNDIKNMDICIICQF